MSVSSKYMSLYFAELVPQSIISFMAKLHLPPAEDPV